MKLAVAAVAALTVASPAAAQTPIIDRTATAWRGHPVYVHPMSPRLRPREVRRLEREIEEEAHGPLVIAVLPQAARREAGGTTTGVALELSRRVVTTNPPATYAVVIGNELRAVNRDVDAMSLIAAALRAERGRGLAAVLADFIRRVGEARTASVAPVEPPVDEEGSRNLWIVAAAAVAVAGLTFGALRRRRRG